MKCLFALLSALLLFTSCGTTKDLAQNTAGESVQTDDRLSGKVFVSYKGCPAIIETMVDGNAVKMYPVNLKDEFKQDGLKIKFTFTPSKAPQPEGCTLIDMVVAIENVEKI
jgi:hypothetical protein